MALADSTEKFLSQRCPACGRLGGMKNPELTHVGWLGPKDEMDRASHAFGKCSECREIICVEKAVVDPPNTQPETNKVLDKAFRAHVKLKHGPNALHTDVA